MYVFNLSAPLFLRRVAELHAENVYSCDWIWNEKFIDWSSALVRCPDSGTAGGSHGCVKESRHSLMVMTHNCLRARACQILATVHSNEVWLNIHICARTLLYLFWNRDWNFWDDTYRKPVCLL